MSEIKFIGNQSDLANWLNTIDGLLKMDIATECQKKNIESILNRVKLDVIKSMTIPQAEKWVEENVQTE
ncbi:TPA: hypothetical protein NG675_004970 [Vibrio parahaemolyticus]|nr:hypothetical protein [Vibrio parahaemolyticus]HCE2814411.1 hypothetical protein [Vibrio parahaemolyticus]HCE2818706.1 hypothetical protein [Vibrio parahaemolyticus]HCG5303161.1 hypothetical protein [Vibrio parahaemolyticus]HCG5307354.1 hypothetical protein [Vibrio parahaemolyticus]